MRHVALLAGLVAVGCADMYDTREQEMASRGITQADLEAPPQDGEIRARILNDVRNTWLPEADLHKGSATCDGIRWEGVKPFCAACQERAVLKVFTLRADAPDKQYPVRETAYFCPTESHYWYHYEGGPLRKDTWLGPRRIKLRTPKGLPDDH
jgi:hypothetical protein